MMKAYAVTDIGLIRQNNQDYAFAQTESVGCLPNLFVVADGMGGYSAGDVASRTATETVVENIRRQSGQNTIKVLSNAVTAANDQVIAMAGQSEEYKGMGTTLVVATIIGQMLYVANVGDSRLYVISSKEIEQITRDHSLVEEMVVNGEINRNEARTHEKKNIITRAVGGTQLLMADYFDVRLREGERILLCTDGLTNMLDDEEIRTIVAGESDITEAAEHLVGEAKLHGGKDNIGIVLIEP